MKSSESVFGMNAPRSPAMVDELICDLGREYGLKQRAAIQENIIRRSELQRSIRMIFILFAFAFPATNHLGRIALRLEEYLYSVCMGAL